MPFNFYDTHTLLMAVQQLTPAATFLRDRYFPTNDASDIFATDDVLVEFRDGSKKLAPFVAPRKGGVTVLRAGYNMERYTPPFVAPRRVLTLDELRKRGFGEALYIKPLGLRLNGKTQILPLKNGIDFLGFHTYLTQTGKVVRKVRAKSIDNMKRKIRKFRGLVDSGKMTLDSVVQSYASWTGHISHGNTYHLRQNMDAYFFSYFPELKSSPKGDTTHGPKTEQPCKQVEGQVRQPVRQPDRLDRGR